MVSGDRARTAQANPHVTETVAKPRLEVPSLASGLEHTTRTPPSHRIPVPLFPGDPPLPVGHPLPLARRSSQKEEAASEGDQVI